jgi:hypothetical protein
MLTDESITRGIARGIARAAHNAEEEAGLFVAHVLVGAALSRGAVLSDPLNPSVPRTKGEALAELARTRGEALAAIKREVGGRDWYLGVLVPARWATTRTTNADLILTDGDNFVVVAEGITIRPRDVMWETAAVLDLATMDFIGDPDEDNLRTAAEALRKGRSGAARNAAKAAGQASLALRSASGLVGQVQAFLQSSDPWVVRLAEEVAKDAAKRAREADTAAKEAATFARQTRGHEDADYAESMAARAARDARAARRYATAAATLTT